MLARVGLRALPLHAGGILDHRTQLRRRIVGAVLLDEGGGDGKHDHDGDDNGGTHVAEEDRGGCQREEQPVQRILGPAPQLGKDRRLLLPGNYVEARDGKPLLSRLRVQTVRGRLQPGQDLVWPKMAQLLDPHRTQGRRDRQGRPVRPRSPDSRQTVVET